MSNVTTAILFANSQVHSGKTLSALLNVGGRPILARNIIQLSRQGISHFVIVAEKHHIKNIHNCYAKLHKAGHNFSVSTAFADTASSESETCLCLPANALLDERITHELLARPETHMRASHNVEGNSNKTVAIKTSLSKARAVANFESLIASLPESMATFDIASLPLYIANRRRDIPVISELVTDEATLPSITGRVLNMAQKGTLDWPARWIHPYFENNMVKLLLPTSITPNMITLVTGVIGFWITYLFATGQMITATFGAMIIGVLDGVDGKLARTKMLESNVGELEHLVDKVVEYSWYFAMAYYFSASLGNAVWGLAVIAVCFAWAETVQGEFYRRLTGVQLDDAGTFEKYWRLVGGRRNTFIWTFLPFTLLGYAYAGLWMIALYSLITFFVAQVRFIVRFRNYANTNGGQIAENWAKTAYF